jgi:periplasmic mercuric ion binding protein
MKTFKIVSLLPLFMALAIVSFAQKATTESIPVSGNCGMCKTTIEKAAKKAGASSASWSADTKVLTIKYSNSTTNAAKIQQGISAAGYDTRDFKTTDAAYNKLPACCQYDRAEAKQARHQCIEKCGMKDGKCADMAACKEKGCCKDEADCKEKGCCNMDKSAAVGEKTKASCCSKMEATMASSDSKEMSCCSGMH